MLYHAVEEPSAEDRLGLRVSPAQFRRQMAWLKEHGYRVVPLNSLRDDVIEPAAKTVAITFDDGYASQLAAAIVLEEFGFPATFFVVPAFLDGHRRGDGYWERWGYFDWRQLATLAARGFEIGAHSASHAPLTRSGPEALAEETGGAKARLERELGRAVESFSYPHGAFSKAVAGAVREAGYRLACTSLYGANRVPASWYTLRRIEVTGQDRLMDFAWKLSGKYDWFAAWQRLQLARA